MSALSLGLGGLGALGAAYLASGVRPAPRLPQPAGGAGQHGVPGPPDLPDLTAATAFGDRARVKPVPARGVRPWHAVAVGVLLAMLEPALAPLPLAALVVLTRLERRRRQRRHAGAVVDQLPDLVDLLRLTTLAGLPVSAALGAIGARPGGVVGSAVARSAQMLDRGATTEQALALLTEACGGPVRSLVDALADHDRYGTPLGPSLERVAVECRLRRRRRAEEAARRLPVTLLFPLVLTTLPAFVLLTIVPLLAGSFSSLQI